MKLCCVFGSDPKGAGGYQAAVVRGGELHGAVRAAGADKDAGGSHRARRLHPGRPDLAAVPRDLHVVQGHAAAVRQQPVDAEHRHDWQVHQPSLLGDAAHQRRHDHSAPRCVLGVTLRFPVTTSRVFTRMRVRQAERRRVSTRASSFISHALWRTSTFSASRTSRPRYFGGRRRWRRA